MTYHEGYIAITDPGWVRRCAGHNATQVNYWIRRKVFKAVSTGAPVFFLEKGSRLIRGFGEFRAFNISTVLESWCQYGVANGASSYDAFLGLLNCAQENAKTYEIGNVLIDDVIWATESIPIDLTDINFPKSVVSGKRISSTESDMLVNLVRGQ